MAVTAVLGWSGLVVTKTARDAAPMQKQAQKVWTVAGTNDPTVAIEFNGTPGDDNFVAEINDFYSSANLDMLCRDVTAKPIGFGIFEVTAHYEVPPRGQWPQKNQDPLQEPPVIQWEPTVVDEPFDRDIDGNPLLNAAGSAITGATRTMVKWTLRITKNRPFFDFATLKSYSNTINNGDMTSTEPNGAVVTFPKGTMKCVTVAPAQAYRPDDLYVPISATFEIYVLNDGIETDKPHQFRVLNKGKVGWYAADDDDATPTKGVFCWQDGKPVDEEVLMYSDGTPRDDSIWVTNGMDNIYPPIPNPEPPDWFDVEAPASGGATFLVFKRYSESNFNALMSTLGV